MTVSKSSRLPKQNLPLLWVLNVAVVSLAFGSIRLMSTVLSPQQFVLYGLVTSQSSLAVLLFFAPMRLGASRLVSTYVGCEKGASKAYGRKMIQIGALAAPIVVITAYYVAPAMLDGQSLYMALACAVVICLCSEAFELLGWSGLVTKDIAYYVTYRIGPRCILPLGLLLCWLALSPKALTANAVFLLVAIMTLVVAYLALGSPPESDPPDIDSRQWAKLAWPQAATGVFSWWYLLAPRYVVAVFYSANYAGGFYLFQQIINTGAATITSTAVQRLLPDMQLAHDRQTMTLSFGMTRQIAMAIALIGAIWVAAAALVYFDSSNLIFRLVGMQYQLPVKDILYLGATASVFAATQLARTVGDAARRTDWYLVPTLLYAVVGVLIVCRYGFENSGTLCKMLLLAEVLQFTSVLVVNATRCRTK